MTAPAVTTVPDPTWFADEISLLLPTLNRVARRLCHNRTDAEDLVAETLSKAWHKLPTLADPQALHGWLLRILSNTYLSQYRAARTRPCVAPLGADAGDLSRFERLHPPAPWGLGDPEQELLAGVVRTDLRLAFAALPEPFRTVVLLVDVGGMSYRDVADQLGVPVGTVRSRLHRGHERLQGELSPYRNAAAP